MTTLLSELPGIDIEPPSPKPKHEYQKRTRAPPKGQPRTHQNVAKYKNLPPDPLYYFKDGLRRVNPYYYTYNTFCKERWRGKTLYEIFSSEFRDRPLEYYKEAIAKGTVCVCGTDKVSVENGSSPISGLDTIVKNGDLISHTTHRHEPPVTDQPIGVVYEDENIMAINKPAGVPVHPTGRYNYNSVTEILRHERPGFNPLPCNRLDRLTSGLMFVAKTREAAELMMIQLSTRTIKKQYVARVKGEFPLGEVMCDQPILQISPKLGLNRVKANGKSAKTLFRRLRYNKEKNYSIVECNPYTGRTHQLRVHLQYLGYPITNDPIYCNRRVFGVNLGKGGEGDDEDIITRLNKMGKTEVAEAEAYHEEIVEDHQRRKAEKLTGETCKLCDTPLYSDPGPHELGIYLHAIKYECEDGAWSYKTDMPAWALEDEDTDGQGLKAEGETEDKGGGKEEKSKIEERIETK